MKTIEEKNRMIAEFMGIEEEQTENGEFVYAVKFQNPEKLNDIQTEFYYGSELRYHTSWDWLMPVCKKINSILFSEFAEIVWQEWNMINNPVKYSIENVHKQVVQFIEWYNNLVELEREIASDMDRDSDM